MFVMLAGSSGVGKNTLINALIERNNKVALMVTLTTREIRPGEKQGDPFYFHTKEEFQQKIKNNELFEHELIHGNFYGSSKKIFAEALKNGKVLIKDIGVEGSVNLSILLKDYTNTIKVFLRTKTKKELVRRLEERGESKIKHRLKRFDYEQGERYKFDFIILNCAKEQTLDLLQEVINNGNEMDNYVFTKPARKLNNKKIKALSEEYKVGFMPKPIKVLAGITICKEVKENKKIRILSKEQTSEWAQYLKTIDSELKEAEREKIKAKKA